MVNFSEAIEKSIKKREIQRYVIQELISVSYFIYVDDLMVFCKAKRKSFLSVDCAECF